MKGPQFSCTPDVDLDFLLAPLLLPREARLLDHCLERTKDNKRLKHETGEEGTEGDKRMTVPMARARSCVVQRILCIFYNTECPAKFL